MSRSGKKKNTGDSPNYLFEEVLKVLQNASEPLNHKQISYRLKIEDNAQKILVNFLLRDMEKKKTIKGTGGGKYIMERGKSQGRREERKNIPKTFSSSSQYVIGKAVVITSGAAYIVVEGREQDIYVAQRNTLNAISGDKVKVRLVQGRNKKPEGVIEEIVERAKSEFVGTIQMSTPSTRGAFLVPDNSKIHFTIHISLDKLLGAKNGQKAVAKIIRWSEGGKSPEGEILRVLGEAGTNDTEIHAILEEFGLPYMFPKEVEKFAERIPIEITKEEISARKDFRNITTFTIDPVDAKDFDDAISVRKLQNGFWEIGVHIADVAHYLKENTILDKEAYARATSVYLVDRVVPMLPENLSNVLCSLRPKEEKLCFSAVFEMDDNAKVHKRWFGRTVINSDRRFTYEEAQTVIETSKGDFSKEILLLDTLAKKLRADRFKRGSIAFDKLEVKFHLDESGNPTGVFAKQMKDANKLIEDFMLLANKEVALFCSPNPHEKQSTQYVPFVYRVHDKPDGEKLKTFAEVAARFGYKINLKNESTIAETMNKTLKDVSGKPEANMIEMLAIRTMAKAIYTSENIGHYGLSFSHYTHFTSPIRRYPDVMVHRLLAQKLQVPSSKFQVNTKTLEDECKHSSQREKLAAEAERASTRYKQVQYLKNRVGEEFDGMISGVTEWGIFVELTESHCEGLVRLKDARDDHYYFDEKNYCYIGKKTKRKLSLGDKVRIEIKKADMIKKQLDFVLVN